MQQLVIHPIMARCRDAIEWRDREACMDRRLPGSGTPRDPSRPHLCDTQPMDYGNPASQSSPSVGRLGQFPQWGNQGRPHRDGEHVSSRGRIEEAKGVEVLEGVYELPPLGAAADLHHVVGRRLICQRRVHEDDWPTIRCDHHFLEETYNHPSNHCQVGGEVR